MTPLRLARFAVGLACAVVTDLRAMARRRVLRAIDEAMHGAPCPCCWQDDCWAPPSADTKENRS